MASAPADPSLPDGLRAFQGLHPGIFYDMAPGTIIQRGVGYFVGERVRGLRFEPRTGTIEAEVEGTRSYSVNLGVEGGRLVSECDCPAWGDAGVCEHAVAAAAALFGVLQGRAIGGTHVHPGYVERLRGCLMASIRAQPGAAPRRRKAESRTAATPAPARVPGPARRTNAEILLQEQPFFGLCVQLRGHFPADFRSGVRPLQSWSLSDSLLPLTHGDRAQNLLLVCRLAGRHGIPVYIEHRGRRIALGTEPVHCTDLAALDIAPDRRIQGAKFHVARDRKLLNPILEINETAFIDETGALVLRDTTPALALLELLAPRAWPGAMRWFPEARRPQPPPPEGVPIADFNARAMDFVCDDWHELLPGMLLKSGNQPVPAPNPARPEEASIELHIDPGASGTMTARIVAAASGAKFSLQHVGERLGRFLLAYDIDDRLVSAKGRVQRLVDAALRLHAVEKSREREALIDEAARDPVFSKLRLRASAKRFLRQYLKDWAAPPSRQAPRLVALPGAEKPWRFVRFPAPAFAQLCIRLASPCHRDDLAGVGREMTLHRTTLSQFLQNALAACAASGAALRYKGQPVERAGVEIDIEITDAPGTIDWFELKAEVRCASLTIPQREWEKLIRGELLLQHEGRLIIPEPPPTGALGALHHLAPPAARPDGRKRDDAPPPPRAITRLQILEWLELRKAGARVKAPPEIEAVFKSLSHFEGIPHAPVPAILQAHLRDYQKRGFDWLLFLHRHRFGACLADDMGLGKTLQAIALLAALKEEPPPAAPAQRPPHLVVVPPSLVFNWRQEIERFCPALGIAEYHGGRRELDAARRADVVLTTYDIVRIDIEKLEPLPFGVVVFDETQTLKNLAAARTQAASRLKRRFTLCLTGTPLENHVGEYYSIINLALPGLFGDYRAFRARAARGDNDLISRARPFVLRRTKEQTLRELPPKTEQDVYLDMTPEQKEFYTRTVGEVREEVLNAYKLKTRSQAGIAALAALMRLRQICISPEILGRTLRQPAPKIGHLVEKLAELDGEGHAALVFSQFTRALDLVEAAVRQRGLRFIRMDGRTPTGRRRDLVTRFQSGEGESFFLISLKTGGVGLNLTRANYVFHVDPWWNPAVENQASDRAHRIGQRQAVFVQRILMRHSIEEKMMLLKARKQALFDQILGAAQGEKGPATLISREDFEFLLG